VIVVVGEEERIHWGVISILVGNLRAVSADLVGIKKKETIGGESVMCIFDDQGLL
jgi:hypothetical protein